MGFNYHLRSGFETAKTEEAELKNKWFRAAASGDLETIQEMATVIDVNVIDAKRRTALIVASRWGHKNIVAFLLGIVGLYIDHPDDESQTALLHAQRNKHYIIAKLIMDKLDRFNELEPWFEAARQGNSEILAKLLPTTDVNIQNQEGDNALIIASYRGHEHLVKFLIQVQGIDVKLHNRGKYTALSAGVQAGYENIVRILIELPAVHTEINRLNGFDSSALIYAASQGQDNIVKLLLQSPSLNINVRNKRGTTALMHACSAVNKNIVMLLLQMPDIDVNAQNISGSTALMLAADVDALDIGNYEDRAEIIKNLLEVPGIDINAQGKGGKTALMYAIESEQPILVDTIKNKISELIDQAIGAIRQNNLEKFKSIIAQIGIDTVVDKEGNTFLDKAFAANCPEIIMYLLQNIKDPQAALSRFPFEHVPPTSDIFKFCMDIAYATPDQINIGTGALAVKTVDKADFNQAAQSGAKINFCSYCCKENCTQKCSKCHKAYYCNSECQKSDWKAHKTICKAD